MNSNSKMKVITVVGTRPEIIRLSRVIDKLDNYTNHFLVHTGQNFDFELNEIFFEQLSIRKPDIFLNAAGQSSIQTIGLIIQKIEKVFTEIKPDALLLLGDTNSAFVALSAKKHKIPIFHMEAGNRCFDQRVPEEVNRKLIDHISDINLTYSQIAREYLLKENFPADQIIVTGSPMKEVIEFYHDKISSSRVLEKLNLKVKNYFVVSVHREENVDSPNKLSNFIATLNHLAESYKMPIVISTHPRTKKQIDFLNIDFNNLIKFHKPFGFLDYIQLQKNSFCVLSDSGTITEESSILNFKALNLREMHERPEGFTEASVPFVGFDSDRIFQSLKIIEHQKTGIDRTIEIVDDYKSENVSEKIIRIIVSYTNYINRKVWKKNL